MERQEIVRTDFPTARRGYDRDAVEAHLRRIAGALAAGTGDSVAEPVSNQVKEIIAAAERTAADLERKAREEAERLGADAMLRARDDAARVIVAADSLVGRIDAIETELVRLLTDLRSRAESIRAVMVEVESGATEARAHAPDSAIAAAAPPPPRPTTGNSSPAPPSEPQPPAPERKPVTDSGKSAAGNARARRTADGRDGARLVALDMVLGGRSRAEIDDYLSVHFDLEDRSAVIDEVFEVAQV